MNKTAIVIDDDEISILLLSNSLKLKHFKVISFSNGKDACELFLKHPADVIICDIFMPEMDGIETIRAIRLVNTKVLIVAITSHDLAYLSFAKKFGANLTFLKSESPQSIVNVILDRLNNNNVSDSL